MTVQEARDYIGRFHLLIGQPSPVENVWLGDGTQLSIKTLNDDELINVAEMLQDIEIKAGRPQGVPLQ